MKKYAWIVTSLLLTLSMVLAGCAPQATQTPSAAGPTEAPGKVAPTSPPAAPAPTDTQPVQPTTAPTSEPKILKVRIAKDIGNLDPAFIVGSEDDTVDRAIMEGLVRYNAQGKMENQLAETLKVSADGLRIDFKLREGVMWQKGYGELTTDDVKFSYERFRDPNLKAAYADDFASLDHVEIINKYEGALIFKQPQATLWTVVLPMTSGLIMSKKYVEEVGLDKIKTDPIGTGPYILAEWKPAEKITLKRNPDYWGTPPYYDEIQLFPISDDKSAEIALRAGELDFSPISLASTDQFQKDSNFNVSIIPSTAYSWIGMDVENPKLQDINVRQAIRYGIDVPSILAAAYNNKAPQARALIPEGTVGYWADAPLYQRDVAKAKDYLAKAGVSNLELNLAIQDTTEFRTWAEIVQANLQEVGITINIQPLDSSTFWDIGSGDKGKDVELFAIGYSSVGPEPAWATQWFTCSQVGVWNWMRWCNADYDKLHEEGIVTLDTAKREQIYIDMQKLWDEAVISVWVTNVPQIYASKPTIKPVIYPGGLAPMLREFTGS
jgi:peptide/nickel transport system substrate-binding protein